MGYSGTELNQLAKAAPYSVKVAGFNAGEVWIYRVLLSGGPPHGTRAVSHLSAVVPAMAEMPSVDCDEYVVRGVTLLEVPPGATLLDQGNDERITSENAYVADVVIESLGTNNFWFDRGDNESKLRSILSNWGGGYSPSVTLLALTRATERSGWDSVPAVLKTAAGFWKQQPPLYYVKEGQKPSPQSFYQQNVGTGTLGVGFSEGISDMPGRLIPFQWSTQQSKDGEEPLPLPVPQPPGPGQKPPATKASSQGMLVMAATAVLGYVLYRRWAK
jgi:hypothetical protein